MMVMNKEQNRAERTERVCSAPFSTFAHRISLLQRSNFGSGSAVFLGSMPMKAMKDTRPNCVNYNRCGLRAKSHRASVSLKCLMVALSGPYRTLASQEGGRSLGPQLSPLQGPLGPLAAAGGIRHGFGSLGVNFVLKTITSRVPPSGGPARADFCGGSLALLTPCPKSAAVGALSPYFAGSLRRFAPLPRTLPDACGGSRPHLALGRMPVAAKAQSGRQSR